jgi:hypothetical protein
MGRARPAAIAVALATLLLIVGGAAFALTRDGSPPPTTTTTTSTTLAPPTRDELTEAIAGALAQGLEAPLTAPQATCVATAFLDVVGEEAALALADEPTPLGAVTIAQREEVVQGIVFCVPPEIAAALLSTASSTVTLAPGLPDDGSSSG